MNSIRLKQYQKFFEIITKNISNLLENEIQENDKILATENVLLLYYLNLPNIKLFL